MPFWTFFIRVLGLFRASKVFLNHFRPFFIKKTPKISTGPRKLALSSPHNPRVFPSLDLG